ncbi:MAG: macro domain-containing protein [Synergistaceae bacterium]|nr:macro domain-containing protein [Synergistaceae bacterium]
MEVDAIIINAANTALRMGGCVCGAIFSSAGAAANTSRQNYCARAILIPWNGSAAHKTSIASLW